LGSYLGPLQPVVILIKDNVLNKNIYTVNWRLFRLLHSQWPFPMQK
jgi:hypothetical protein